MIRTHLLEEGQVSVSELSRALGVSLATIRRDLHRLKETGLLDRTHGGGVAAFHFAEPDFARRRHLQREEKERIGLAAARLVGQRESVLLTSGTTTFEVAKNLAPRRDITIITNSLNIASYLATQSKAEVVVLGGMVRPGELSMLGHLTEHALRELRTDKLIMGIPAVDAGHGLTNDYLPEVMTDRALIEAARQVVIVADHTKFGRVLTALVAPVLRIHTLVTDDRTASGVLEALRDLGIQVIVA